MTEDAFLIYIYLDSTKTLESVLKTLSIFWVGTSKVIMQLMTM